MTPVDRDELKRLLTEATPGPWEYGERYGNECIIGPSGSVVSGEAGCEWNSGIVVDDKDAALIVALRNSADALVRDSELLDRLVEALPKCHALIAVSIGKVCERTATHSFESVYVCDAHKERQLESWKAVELPWATVIREWEANR